MIGILFGGVWLAGYGVKRGQFLASMKLSFVDASIPSEVKARCSSGGLSASCCGIRFHSE